jgi:hypothetical protein
MQLCRLVRITRQHQHATAWRHASQTVGASLPQFPFFTLLLIRMKCHRNNVSEAELCEHYLTAKLNEKLENRTRNGRTPLYTNMLYNKLYTCNNTNGHAITILQFVEQLFSHQRTSCKTCSCSGVQLPTSRSTIANTVQWPRKLSSRD